MSHVWMALEELDHVAKGRPVLRNADLPPGDPARRCRPGSSSGREAGAERQRQREGKPESAAAKGDSVVGEAKATGCCVAIVIYIAD